MKIIDKKLIKKYSIYLLRWQCSTPILAIVLYIMPFGNLVNSIIANIVGGLIFFWIDLWIFRNKK